LRRGQYGSTESQAETLGGRAFDCAVPGTETYEGKPMHSIIYIVGAVVIVVALLSFVGLA